MYSKLRVHTTNKHSNTHTPFLLLQIFYLRAKEKTHFSSSNCRVLGLFFFCFVSSTQRTLLYTMYSLFSIQFLSLINYQCLLLLLALCNVIRYFVSVPFYRFTFCCYSIRVCVCECVGVFFYSVSTNKFCILIYNQLKIPTTTTCMTFRFSLSLATD